MFGFAKGYLHTTFQKHINFARQDISNKPRVETNGENIGLEMQGLWK